MRPIEIGSGFASGIPETVVPLHANVSVPVSTACAVVDRPANKIIAAAVFMVAPPTRSSSERWPLASVHAPLGLDATAAGCVTRISPAA
jgi:hypothetical protein